MKLLFGLLFAANASRLAFDNFYNDEAGSDQWKRGDDFQRVDFGEMVKRALEDDDFML